jgi:hypothetical protein
MFKEMFIHLIGVLKHPSVGWGRIKIAILLRFVSELLLATIIGS